MEKPKPNQPKAAAAKRTGGGGRSVLRIVLRDAGDDLVVFLQAVGDFGENAVGDAGLDLHRLEFGTVFFARQHIDGAHIAVGLAAGTARAARAAGALDCLPW